MAKKVVEEESHIQWEIVFAILFLCFIVWLMGSCSYGLYKDNQKDNQKDTAYNACLQQFYDEGFPLHSIGPKESIHGNIEGGYFLIAGAVNGSIDSKTEIRFSFNRNGQFVFATLPFGRIRVVTEEIENPYVQFVEGHPDYDFKKDCDDVENLMNTRVKYAIVHCKDSQFPKSLDFSMGFKNESK